MRVVYWIALCSALVTASTPAFAQFVKGNEAVKVMADGTKKVETAPLPSTGPILKTKPCLASAGCNAGSWLMVETQEGLMECTEAYARPGTCRASTYGTTKLSRLWVVKSGSNWLQCQFADLGSKCVDMFARPPANLPFDAIQ
jgi:hypothetical protein